MGPANQGNLLHPMLASRKIMLCLSVCLDLPRGIYAPLYGTARHLCTISHIVRHFSIYTLWSLPEICIERQALLMCEVPLPEIKEDSHCSCAKYKAEIHKCIVRCLYTKVGGA